MKPNEPRMSFTIKMFDLKVTVESGSEDYSGDEMQDLFDRALMVVGYPPSILRDGDGHWKYVDEEYEEDKPEDEIDARIREMFETSDEEPQKKLIRNRIKCKKCGEIIESKTVHDFVRCSCGAVATDGGLEYMHVSGNVDDWENLSEWE